MHAPRSSSRIVGTIQPCWRRNSISEATKVPRPDRKPSVLPMQKGHHVSPLHLKCKFCRISILPLLPAFLHAQRLVTTSVLPFSFSCLFGSVNALNMDVIADAAQRVDAVGPRTVVMLIVAVVFLVISWISFSLRVYVRVILIHSWGWDDWMILLTILLSTTCCSLLICIEQIEQSERPQRALEKGIQAQLDLLNYLMKVCYSRHASYTCTDHAHSLSSP
jgi:hypothetical protein